MDGQEIELGNFLHDGENFWIKDKNNELINCIPNKKLIELLSGVRNENIHIMEQNNEDILTIELNNDTLFIEIA